MSGKKSSKRNPTSPLKHKRKKQRVHVEVPELTEISYTELEDMQIEVHLRKGRMKDFKLAQMYAFMFESSRWKKINYERTDEFLANYDVNLGSSMVEGKRIVLRETLMQKALRLPISELAVGDARAPPEFEPGQYFKTGMEALDARQGWKIGEAESPDLVEWLRFVQKRLVLGVHGTYLAQRYLYPAIQTFNGMVFNWALFVVERIHQDLEAKLKKGKIGSLPGACYISLAIQYELENPTSTSDQELQPEGAPSAVRMLPERQTEEEVTVTEESRPEDRVQQRTQQGQKDKAVVPEVSNPAKKKRQIEEHGTSSTLVTQPMERDSGSMPLAEEETERGTDANQAAEESGKFKDYIIKGLEQMTDWVKKYQEPDYAKMASDLKVLRVGGRKLQAEFQKATTELTELRTEVVDLRQEKVQLLKDREACVERIRKERERNEIAFATWQEARTALEAKLKKSQEEHQRIKDDLDVQLSKALQENIALQEAVRERENRLEQVERDLSKAVEKLAVHTESPKEGAIEGTVCTEDWKKRAENLEKKLQSLGRYNQELLDKYEPTLETEEEEEELEEEPQEEEPEGVTAGGREEVLLLPPQPTEEITEGAPRDLSTVNTAADEGGDQGKECDAVASMSTPTQTTTEEPMGDAPTITASVPATVMVVQGQDSVFEVVPRICEDANR